MRILYGHIFKDRSGGNGLVPSNSGRYVSRAVRFVAKQYPRKRIPFRMLYSNRDEKSTRGTTVYDIKSLPVSFIFMRVPIYTGNYRQRGT